MIDTDRAEKAIEFLIETDNEAAELKSMVEYLKEGLKVIIAKHISLNDGPGIGQREAEAKASPEYAGALHNLQRVQQQFEALKNRRFTADQVIQVYRTQSANYRNTTVHTR